MRYGYSLLRCFRMCYIFIKKKHLFKILVYACKFLTQSKYIRLPKAVFYSELHHGKRSHGGQKLRFKDVLKRHLKKTGISHKTWEEEAAHRVKWQGLLRKAMSAVEE